MSGVLIFVLGLAAGVIITLGFAALGMASRDRENQP
jgi:hypothetical protein